MSREVCVLLSGGLDSSVLVASYLERGMKVRPVYVECGFRWERREKAGVRAFLGVLRRGRISPSGAPGAAGSASGRRPGAGRGGALLPIKVLHFDQRDLYPPRHWALSGPVPSARARWDSVELRGRNMLLLSRAAAALSGPRGAVLALATLKGNPFPDATPAFFKAAAKALTLGLGIPIRVETPFLGTSKERLVRLWARLPLGLTFSCLRPSRGLHCGLCTKCFERRRAFRKAGVPDPTRYAA